MKIKIIVSLFFSAALLSCSNNNETGKQADQQNHTVRNPVVSDNQIIPGRIPVELFDSIEHFFGNENWQLINGADTSYWLFSRQNDTNIKVYMYKMSKGDSVNSFDGNITFQKDAVIWNTSTQSLALVKASKGEMTWKAHNLSDTSSLIFNKVGNETIFLQENGKKIKLTKTITSSDFFVRSHYDFLHGTHYAFDTTNFNAIKKKKEPSSMIKVKQ